MSANKLLVPKWKDRTQKTHNIHLETVKRMIEDKKTPTTLFLGDSMFERWRSTGRELWYKMRHVFNAGVGGDRIENLLWRLTPPEDVKGILDELQFTKIYLMIGTNNVDKDDINKMSEACIKVIDIIFNKQPGLKKLYLFAILDRTDVDDVKISGYNELLKQYCEKSNYGDKIEFIDFSDKVNDDKYYDDHVHLNKDGYQVWYDVIVKHLY